MKVENYPIESVIPYARNPRKNDEAATKVAASIKEFGWQQPIVVDSEMVIIAGHTRLLAAQRLGLDEVPVAIAADLSPEQVKAFRIADNRVAQEAEWDKELLSLEFNDLNSIGFDLELTGFTDEEISAISFVPDFEPANESEQGKLDELNPKIVDCPKCGHSWDFRKQDEK